VLWNGTVSALTEFWLRFVPCIGATPILGKCSLNGATVRCAAMQFNPAVRVVARCHDIRNAVDLNKARADALATA